MRAARIIGVASAMAASGCAGASALVAVMAGRPRLVGRVFGHDPAAFRSPAEFGLDSTDVEYRLGCRAWWIPAVSSAAAVVIVHGHDSSPDPRATPFTPLLDVAAMLQRHSFASLVINLGYASGTRVASGGELEARDIADAVAWIRRETDLPVAILAFSAGAISAAHAAGRSDPFAVVTDSGFVDFGEVVKDQARSLTNVPSTALVLVAPMMRLVGGHWPLNLARHGPFDRPRMLHVHGDADQAIPSSNASRLATITGGEVWIVAGADHNGSFTVDAAAYERRIVAFLQDALLDPPARA